MLVALLASGCAKWAYTPTWKGGLKDEGVQLKLDMGGTCGELSVTNRTDAPLKVRWEGIKTVLPDGERTAVRLYAKEGEAVRNAESIAAGQTRAHGLCLKTHTYDVRARPPTAYDFALGWYFGLGILAGNVAWKPKTAKIQRVVGNPRAYGFDLVVPVEGRDGAEKLKLAVKGDGATAFKYSRRVHGPPADLPVRR